MPNGIFLLVHDEIRGPQIKATYYTTPVDLSQEFISKLYMSHASFEKTSMIEIKFGNNKIISYFTGHVARAMQKEGILGIVFREDEKVENLELFLKRNLDYCMSNQDEKTLKEVFTKKLHNYLKINEAFDKVEIENIPEIFIATGIFKLQSILLKVGEKNINYLEFDSIFQQIVNKEPVSKFQFQKLNLENGENAYLIMKATDSDSRIERIISLLKPYVEKYYTYTLEILALFFLPHIILVKSIEGDWKKEALYKDRTILDKLEQSENYIKEFENYIRFFIDGKIEISFEFEN